MTVEWFDLAQRLHAARTGAVVPRLRHSPLPRIASPVAVRARKHGQSVMVTAAAPDTPTLTARDSAALRLLGDLGVRITAERWQTLVTDNAATLTALLTLARSADPDGPAGEVATHIAWSADRGDFPGSSAVVRLLDGCRTRWITGSVPDAETNLETWRAWLDVTDDSIGGLLTLLDRLSGGEPLPLLDSIGEDDSWAWSKAQSEHAEGWDWRRPDTTGRAALGLRARCDAADLYAAALLGDPLYRRRAAHTGHVVTGTAEDNLPGSRNRLAVVCDRMDARLRDGNAVTGWTGAPGDTVAERFHGTVHDTGMRVGRLVLTLTGVGAHRPEPGAPVTLTPTAPSPFTMRAGRRRYSRLYGTRRSWLTTGRTPTPTRRDVPLDVLIAGAEDD